MSCPDIDFLVTDNLYQGITSRTITYPAEEYYLKDNSPNTNLLFYNGTKFNDSANQTVKYTYDKTAIWLNI